MEELASNEAIEKKIVVLWNYTDKEVPYLERMAQKILRTIKKEQRTAEFAFRWGTYLPEEELVKVRQMLDDLGI
jgi:hypothetical protein